MTVFVSAEYVIATMLFKNMRLGNKNISFENLNKYSIYIQQIANNINLDVVFLTSNEQLSNAIKNFSDYFFSELDSLGNIANIKLQSNKDVEDLEYYFLAYLPENVLEILLNN